MVQFLNLARKHATRQRSIFYAVLSGGLSQARQPAHERRCSSTTFNRLQSLVPASASRYQSRLPTFAEMLAEPAAVC